jgi:hypothetical protein
MKPLRETVAPHAEEGSPPSVAPQRLVEGDDAVARILRAELRRDHGAGVIDFEVLRARRVRAQVRTQRWLAAALVLGTVGLLFSMREPHRELSITAETWTDQAEPTALADEPPQAEPPATSVTEPPRVPDNVPARATATKESSPKASKKNSPGGSRAQATANDADCRAVTRSSGYEAGARCYGDKAKHGSGVGAEVAWIERARLESRALGRPNEALETLKAYEHRFPSGTLVNEARLTRIELLAAVGRREEALRAIGEAAPLIPERAASLHLLGARLALETDDCSLAAQHLDAAVRARAPADRIDALRRSTKCFAAAPSGK